MGALIFIKSFLGNNYLKIIFFILPIIIITNILLGDIPDTIEEGKVIETVKLSTETGDKYITLYNLDKEPKILIQTKDEIPDNICGDKIILTSTNGWYVFLFIIDIILVVLIVIAPLVDDDFSWCISDSIIKSKLYYVESYIEDNMYHYVYDGRLLYKLKSRVSINTLEDTIENWSYKKKSYPEFESRSQARIRKLAELEAT